MNERTPFDSSECRCSVAVLAGGRSTRMGTDKATMRLLPDDPMLIELVLERVRPLSGDVMIIAADRPDLAISGARLIPERRPSVGPLGGLAAALDAAREDVCVVVACNHPF